MSLLRCCTIIMITVVLFAMACGDASDTAMTNVERILPMPPVDSTVRDMHPDLQLADSLLNHSDERGARAVYEHMYRDRSNLSEREQRILLLRLALTSVGRVRAEGDSVYTLVSDLVRVYRQMAGQSELVALSEEAELQVVLGRLGMYTSGEEAHRHYQQALAIVQSPGVVDPTNAQRLISRIGREYLFRLEWNAEALDAFRRERVLLDSFAYPPLEEMQYFYRTSIAHRRLGQFELAEAAALNGIRLYRESGIQEPEQLLGQMNNMAFIGMAERDTAQVGSYIDSLLPLVGQVYAGDTMDQIFMLINYITSLHHDLQRAMRIADTAIRLSKGHHPFLYADILRARAYVRNGHDQVDGALADFNEAIAIMRQPGFLSATEMSSLGDALLGLTFVMVEKLHQTDGVQEMLDDAVRLGFNRDYGSLLWDTEIPYIVQQEKWQDYLSTYARYLYRKYQNDSDTASLLKSIAVCKRIDSILVYDRRKATDADVLRNVSKQHGIYSDMIEIAMAAYGVAGTSDLLCTAHRFMERSRGYLIESEISFNEAARRIGVPDSLIRLEKELVKSENAILADETRYGSSEWTDLVRSKEAYYQYIQRNYPDLYDVYIDTEIVSMDTVQAALPNDVCVIEYQLQGSDMYALAYTRDSAMLIRSELDLAMLRSLVDTLSRRPPGLHNVSDLEYLRSNLYAAYRVLVAPFQDLLAGSKTVYVLPDGVLQYLPFEALVTFESRSKSFEGLPYLFLSQHIGYAISSGTLYRALGHKIEFGEIAAFAYYPQTSFFGRLLGEGKGTGGELENLPGAMREVRDIEEIFGEQYVSLYFRKNCTTRKFYEEAGKASIIHLGIHAFADPESRFGNGLVFTDTTLYAKDLIGLDLAADLVVLSGCETGLGKHMQGEGLYNFARPFITAGAGQVVMSRWLLHDQTASILMRYFYENLEAGAPAHVALSEARRAFFSADVRPQTAHPYYWSLMCTR